MDESQEHYTKWKKPDMKAISADQWLPTAKGWGGQLTAKVAKENIGSNGRYLTMTLVAQLYTIANIIKLYI